MTAARTTGDFIETRSGKRFTPLAPVVADIDLGDIAHALSHQCRFSGHTAVHYSVAEHSVRVSELLEEGNADRRTQLWGLLHDASEAYLVDLPSPLKSDPRLGFYVEAEARLMLAICERFGLPYREPAAVRIADGILLATEARDLMPFLPEHWSKLPHAPMARQIVPWSVGVAKWNFISRYEELTL